MEEEMDSQPPVNPDKKVSPADQDIPHTSATANGDPDARAKDQTVPHYQQLHVAPADGTSTAEAAQLYSDTLHNAPGFPWQQEPQPQDISPCFAAPYITGADADNLTEGQLISGIFINIPRSAKLWTGDQLKLRWGYNTFYTTVAESQSRDGPRLTQYLNSETLADYENGVVEVRYEVVRRTKLVGISETLRINLRRDGKRCYKSSSRTRAVRRRRLSQ